MSPISHLHTETKILPVKDHLSLLCSQSFAKSLQPTHPSFNTVTSPSGPRDKKQTLQSKFLSTVAPYLNNGSLPPENYRTTIKALHTDAVAAAIAASEPNPLLQTRPPTVADEELSLPRRYRTTLSQLRSGYSSSLAYYRERVGRSDNLRCPSCGVEPQTVPHLFACASHPTALSL